MYLLNSTQISVPNLWEPECCGIFAKIRETVYFYFSNAGRLCSASDNEHERLNLYPSFRDNVLPLPNKWRLIESAGAVYLMFNISMGLDLCENRVLNMIPPFLQEEYRKLHKPEKYYVEEPFYFDDYCISHNGQTGYMCKKGSEVIWKFTGSAYLYTDIFRWKNHVFFGTAGKGGWFYIINLETGELVTGIKTGGTSIIEHQENRCYILQSDKSTKLLCIDIESGQIIDSIPLPGRSTINSVIKRMSNKLYITTFAYRASRLNHIVWNTVELL